MTFALSGTESISLCSPGLRSITSQDLLTWIQQQMSTVKTIVTYGAKGDGIQDDYLAIQKAIDSGHCVIPYSAKGYRISRALNGTNRDRLTIEGIGYAGPQWNLAYSIPVDGSTILADTGGFALDITGSNNVTLKNFNIVSTAAMAMPAICGIVGGTSGDNSRLGSPGGSGYVFENICVALPNIAPSLPIYINNGNVGKFLNVNTMGRYGFCLTMNNPLAVTPPYTTFGTLSASDGNYFAGMVNAGYGQQPVIFLEQANDTQIDQTYIVYLAGAGTFPYPGPGYGMLIRDCTDVQMKIESDNFPSMFRMEGSNLKVSIDGIICADPIPTPAGSPCIGFFAGSQIKDCKFHVLPVGSFNANQNYHYSTVGGASPSLASIINCDFYFDTANTPNVAFFDVTSANSVPYFNNTFRGNIDLPVGSTALTMQVNGVAASAAQHRTWMNGLRQGTA